MIIESCRASGTRMHLKVLPSSVHNLYSTPLSLMNIFWSSTSLCNFLATSLQYISFFCSSCNCFGFNGRVISLTSSCSVILMQGRSHKFGEDSLDSLSSSRLHFFSGFSSYLIGNILFDLVSTNFGKIRWIRCHQVGFISSMAFLRI